MIVDSTRKGKRFPDSMSKTIPIWTCVLNRAISNYRNRTVGGGPGSPQGSVSNKFFYLFQKFMEFFIFHDCLVRGLKIATITNLYLGCVSFHCISFSLYISFGARFSCVSILWLLVQLEFAFLCLISFNCSTFSLITG